jgi:arylsulfatase A-like enzyme
MDKFAKNAAVFESAFVSSSWTLPSYTSILTSLYPLQHGLMSRGDTAGGQGRTLAASLAENFTTLADVLGKKNYLTAAFTGGFDFNPSYGVTSRFDENFYWRPNETSAVSLSDYGSFNSSVPEFSSWLSKNRDRTFFAYVQGFDAHCPFALPQRNDAFAFGLQSNFSFDKCYWTFDRAQTTTIGGKPYYYLLAEYDVSLDASAQQNLLLSEEDVKYMEALYDGEINLVDRYVGEILDSLEREGVLNRTIVVIFSEHGDMLGKHGRFMRGGPLRGTFYDDVLHVPLVIYNPNLNPAGLRQSQLVESIDIAPTVLDMLSISPPAQFAGKSLRPVLVNGTDVHKAVFAATKFLPSWGNFFFRNSTFISAVRTKDWKLIRELVFDSPFELNGKISADPNATLANAVESSSELYDLAFDPQELSNVFYEEPQVASAMQSLLDSEVAAMESGKDGAGK